MRRSLIIIAFLVLLPSGGCQKLKFTEFSPSGGRFSILMPGTPQEQKQKAMGMTVVMYGVNVKNGAYAAGYADLPPGLPANLSGAVQGAANSHGTGKVLSEKDFSLAGETGKEFEAEISQPKGFISGRVIVVKGRLFQALAIGTNARLSNSDVRKFLDSFQITK